MDSQAVQIGQQIRAERKRQGLSAATLAERAGVAPNTISSIENGKTVRDGNLRKVLDALQFEPQSRQGAPYPDSVEMVRVFVTQYMLATPEAERADVADDIVRLLLARPRG